MTNTIKVFDTSTIAGLRAAERFQQKLYGLYNQVVVKPTGINRVCIFGLNPIAS